MMEQSLYWVHVADIVSAGMAEAQKQIAAHEK
jgi:hypothetical protein